MKNAFIWNAAESSPNNMKNIVLTGCLVLLLTSCGMNQSALQDLPVATESPASIMPPSTATPNPSPTPIPPTPTPDYIDHICSPLFDVPLTDLNQILTQPFKHPRVGNDDGHHGVDYAFYRYKDFIGIEGLQVTAALQGKVVTILNDRNPYGYALIIETPLDQIDSALLTSIYLPEIQPTVEPDPRVNCPVSGNLPFTPNESERSLYTMYAHLRDLPTLQIGESVDCGQVIGMVGNTGRSTNPHLHFETRVGPSGASFESMAYYTVQSTEAERYNYCIWRVSNLFQLFDPLLLLSAQP